MIAHAGKPVAPDANSTLRVSLAHVKGFVPREGVTFTTLPSEVVTIYPEWRGYKFIVVHDEIVIIDPNSYEIVAILNT